MPSAKSTTTPMADPTGPDADGYGPETFTGACLGGLMRIDDDRFRLGVLAIGRDDDRVALQVLHRDDRSLNGVVEVGPGSVFDVGDHRIRVVTLNGRAVAVRWAARRP